MRRHGPASHINTRLRPPTWPATRAQNLPPCPRLFRKGVTRKCFAAHKTYRAHLPVDETVHWFSTCLLNCVRKVPHANDIGSRRRSNSAGTLQGGSEPRGV